MIGPFNLSKVRGRSLTSKFPASVIRLWCRPPAPSLLPGHSQFVLHSEDGFALKCGRFPSVNAFRHVAY